MSTYESKQFIEAQIFQVRSGSNHLHSFCNLAEEFLVSVRDSHCIRYLCKQKGKLVILKKQEKEEQCDH